MDNVGDWLYYIVFLVIAGISGLMSSKDKKKNRPDILGQPGRDIVPNDQPTQDKGFWEILEEMANPSPESQPTPQPQVKAKRQKGKSKNSAASVPKPFLTSESSIPEKIAAQSSVMSPVEEVGILQENPFQNIDELKKAVIYAEIFNRKY